MNAEETRKLIEASGGNKAFAMLLGIFEPGYCARITNWKRLGIPFRVQIEKRKELSKLVGLARRRGKL